MEKVGEIVDRFCTFPVIERVKLFERTLFSFLIGNEDMHLKNFSLISEPTRVGPERISLSPGYDLVNSTIALGNAQEETALPIRGKKSRLTRADLFDYYAGERLRINEGILTGLTRRFRSAAAGWADLIAASFLSDESKSAYAKLLAERRSRMDL